MKFNRYAGAIVCSVSVLSATPAQAIIAVDVDNLLRREVLPGQFSGVVSLQGDLFGSNIIDPFCTGSLLTGGQYILTAAHCVTDQGTNTLTSSLLTQPLFAGFNLASGFVNVPVLNLFVLPGWEGFVGRGNDLALLSLLEPAPAEAQQYDIYRDRNELGQTFTKVGYGNLGTGLTGDVITNGLVAFFGQNQFEATEADRFDLVSLPGNAAPFSQLLYDFDSGLSVNNLIGSLGLGDNEVNTGLGDSGGPAFIGNRIAGITSYGLGGFGLVFPTDIDNETNSTFGELSGDTRVSTYASFVDAVLAGRIAPTGQNAAAVPEPSAIAGSVAFGLWMLKRRKRQHGDR